MLERGVFLKKELVRFHSAPCVWSKWLYTFEESLDQFSRVDDLLATHPVDEILHRLCEETKTYAELKSSYDRAVREQKENEDFIITYRIDRRRNLWISPENEIYLIYFQDRLRVAKKRITPWDYPHNIACIGRSDGYNVVEIIRDYKKSSALDFYMKYELCLPNDPKRKKQIKKQADGLYIVDNTVAIRIDAHIYFYALKDRMVDPKTEKYIADSWLTDEEMIDDLTKRSMYRFGRDYLCYWK